MEAKKEAKLNMIESVITCTDENPTPTASVPAFQDSVNVLKVVAADIRTNSLIVTASTKGSATNKKKLKNTMIEQTIIHSSALYALANKTGNDVLKAKANLSASVLKKLKDADVKDKCQVIQVLAAQNQPDLVDYGVDNASIAALETAIQAYMAVISAPKVAKNHVKTANSNIVALFKKADDILKNEMDKTVLPIKKTYPDFVSDYFNNREIYDAPTSSTTFKGIVKDKLTGAPVHAKIIIVNVDHSFNTEPDGTFMLKPAPYGINKLQVEAIGGGYNLFELEKIQFKLGQVTDLTIDLDPIPIP